MYEKINLAVADGLATLTLNAPDKLNAVSRKMVAELKECWEGLANDASVRAVLLTGAGRGLSLTKRSARKLPSEPDVLELDVTDPAQVAAARDAIGERWDRVDGALHAIGFAPPACLGGGFLDMGIAAWVLSCLLFWYVGMPCYLARRPRHDERRRGER